MKIAIVGAGAIGGYLAVELARSGNQVTVVARGSHLEAIQARGLTLRRDGHEYTETLVAVESAAQAGEQDCVFLAVKAHQIAAIASSFRPMLGPDTAVVTAANGIPWWYFHQSGQAPQSQHLQSVDPGGAIWSAIGPERAIGCVVYAASRIAEPGVIEHQFDNRFSLGEPDGSASARIQQLSQVMIDAGFAAPIRKAIRTEIWIKLWGNAVFNPISALTGASLAAIATDAECQRLLRGAMDEVRAVAHGLGVRFAMTTDKRIAGAAAVGDHKTSMLQDLERGREPETDAILGAVRELGQAQSIPTPQLDALWALVQLQWQTR